MKNLVLSLLLFIAMQATAQITDIKLNSETGHAEFQKIIEMPGVSASDLYKSVQKWVAITYKNPDEVLQSQIQNEMLRGNGFASDEVKMADFPFPVYTHLKYSFKIDFKDDKVRYTIYDMSCLSQAAGDMSFEVYVYKKDGTLRTNGQAVNVRESVELYCYNIYLSLQTHLFSKPGVKDDDW